MSDLKPQRRTLPLNIRTYLQALLGRKKPITEDDLSAQEMEMLISMAQEFGAGSYSYQDYPNAFETPQSSSVLGNFLTNVVKNASSEKYQTFIGTSPKNAVRGTLGAFTIDEDPKRQSYRVRDTYDFHDEYDGGYGFLQLLKEALKGNMYALETFAIRYGPNAAGNDGIPVDIALPEGLTDPKYDAVKDALTQQHMDEHLPKSYDEIAAQIMAELGPSE